MTLSKTLYFHSLLFFFGINLNAQDKQNLFKINSFDIDYGFYGVSEGFSANNVIEEESFMDGSGKLTLADLNEESANLLALQTRQQLGINSLALASQSERGILALFG